MKALTCMQRLALRAFKSSAVPQQRCIVGHPPRDAEVDYQSPLYGQSHSRGCGGKAGRARCGRAVPWRSASDPARRTPQRSICVERAGSPAKRTSAGGGNQGSNVRESRLRGGVKKRLRSRESSVFLPECWSSNLRDGLHVGEMKSAWFPSCAEAHDQPNLKLGGGEKRVRFRAVRLLPSPRRARRASK